MTCPQNKHNNNNDNDNSGTANDTNSCDNPQSNKNWVDTNSKKTNKNMAVHKKATRAGTSQSNQDGKVVSLGNLLPIGAAFLIVNGFAINLGNFDQNGNADERWWK